MTRLDEYREVAPPGAVEMLLRLAEQVRGRRFLHVTAGRVGSGIAETLRAALPLLAELGVETGWEVTGGDPPYYATTRALREGLQGAERVLGESALAHWTEMSRVNARKLALDADLVIAHDVAPAGLVESRTKGRWVWRCHFDLSAPEHRAWAFFRTVAARYDAAMFSLPNFVYRLDMPKFIMAPSIDPLSEKNREMPAAEVGRVVAGLGVPRDKPILLQVAPFTPDHDPLGVVNAYRLVKRHHDVRLVLAGTAGGDGERGLLEALREAARGDPDLSVLELPAEAARQINALQRAATIVLQKPVRGAFDLGAAEAMWKGKPVVGSGVGGLSQQIVHAVTGYVVHSVEGAAFQVRHLLGSPDVIARLGAAGREHVRRAFLLTRHLTDYLALMIHLTA